MVAQYAKKGRRQKASKGGRGSARVKDRKREKERESEFSSARQFPNYREAFSSSSCHWCSTFRVLAPSEPLDTRVKCTNPLGLSPLSVCHEYVATVTTRLSKKKKKKRNGVIDPLNFQRTLMSHYWIIGLVGNDQHGVVASEWIHSLEGWSLIRNMRIFESV